MGQPDHDPNDQCWKDLDESAKVDDIRNGQLDQRLRKAELWKWNSMGCHDCNQILQTDGIEIWIP